MLETDPHSPSAPKRNRRTRSAPGDADTAYRPEIDGLRAVAVLSVLLYHGNLGAPGGYVGVDVFFVISGYLITGLIRKDLMAGKFSLASFWERRIRRIAPALFVMVAAVLVAGYCWLLPSHLTRLGRSAVAQVLFSANFYFWRDKGYFGILAAQRPLLHTWSLAVEEQFYLLFPLFLVAMFRFRRRATVPALAVIAGLSFACAAVGVHRWPGAVFSLLPTRAWELLVGSLLAFAPRRQRQGPRMGEVLALLGMAAILIATFWFDDTILFPGVAALLPVGGTAAVIYANAGRLTAIGRCLALSPCVFLGKISYSLYLWHWPIIVFTSFVRGQAAGWPALVSGIVLPVVLAIVSWRYVEQPFRSRRGGGVRPRVFAGFAAAQAVLVGTGALFWATNGLPARFTAEQSLIAADVDRPPMQYNTDIDDLANARLRTLGIAAAPGEPLDFVLFGDSHALVPAQLFDQVAAERGLRGVIVATGGTPILPFTASIQRRNTLLFDLLRDRKVKTVFVVARWENQYPRAATVTELAEILAAFQASGVEHVFVFRQAPLQTGGDGFAQHIFSTTQFGALGKLHRVSRQTYTRQRNLEDELFDRVRTTAPLPFELVDTVRDSFDDRGECRVLEAGRSLYLDDDHLSAHGTEILLQPIVTQLLSEIAPSDGPRKVIRSVSERDPELGELSPLRSTQ